jgi:transcriptional regulator with XRE-family HTH domain
VTQSRNTSKPVSTPEPTTLGAYIRVVRERASLSQRQLASLAGFHHSMLARLESGEVAEQPKLENLQRLADALKIDSADLLAFLGVKPSVPEPKVFFRRAYGMSEDEAVEAERVISELRAHMHEQKSSKPND